MAHFIEHMDHVAYMRAALAEAEKGFANGEYPIGAIIVHGSEIIARNYNTNVSGRSHLAHAELKCLLSCQSYLNDHGTECVLYTTMEPCIMCLSAIVFANIRNIVYGITDDYTGSKTIIQSVPYVQKRVHNYLGGILERESVALCQAYELKRKPGTN